MSVVSGLNEEIELRFNDAKKAVQDALIARSLVALAKGEIGKLNQTIQQQKEEIEKLKTELFELKLVIEYANEIIKDQVECRQDEDCDHCEFNRMEEKAKEILK